VHTHHTTPDNAELGTVRLLLSTVDVGNTLTQVEGGVFLALNVLDANKGGVGALVALAAFEALNAALAV
jgi:hypothetical protein